MSQAPTQELTKTLVTTAQELQKKHTAWASDLVAKEDAIHEEVASMKMQAEAEVERIRRQAYAELQEMKTGLMDEKAAWADECERISHTQKFSSRIKLDVGGFKFTTTRTTLQAAPDSMLDAYFSGRHTNETDDEGYHFIDRDGTHFRHILNFLRDQKNFTLELPTEQMKELINEADYYGITARMAASCPAVAKIVLKKQRLEQLEWLAERPEKGSFVSYESPSTGSQNILYAKVRDVDNDGMPTSLELVVNADGDLDKKIFFSAIKKHINNGGLLKNFPLNLTPSMHGTSRVLRCRYEHAVLDYTDGKPTLFNDRILNLGNIWTWTPLENDITIYEHLARLKVERLKYASPTPAPES